MRTRIAWLLLGGLAAVALTAAACGGDDSAGAASNGGNVAGNAQTVQQQTSGGTAGQGISVSGEAITTVKPDTALLSLGVSVAKPTAREARDTAATAMEALLASVRSNGVSDDDIKTTQFTINPEYDYTPGSPRITGYRVTNTVSAKTHEQDRVAEIIDDAVNATGDPIQISGITFTLDNPETALSDARSRAMASAKAKADELAHLAGVTLGAPISIVENSNGGTTQPLPYAAAAGVASADSVRTSIQTGQLEILLSVQVTYAIQ
jgi:uncharacterized protein YggE